MQGRHRSFGREITKSTVIYGVYTRFWPTLCISLRLGWPEPYIYGIFGREITKSTVMYGVYTQGWPEPYIYVHIRRIFGDFQVKNTVYIPYIHGSGQPYIYTILANPTCICLTAATDCMQCSRKFCHIAPLASCLLIPILLLQECLQHGAAQARGAPVHWTDQHTDAAPAF